MNIKKGLLLAGMVVGILLTVSPFVGFLLGLWQCFHGFGGLLHFSSQPQPLGHFDVSNELESASGFATGYLAFVMSVNASNYLVPIGLFISVGSFLLYLTQKKQSPPSLPPTPQ